MASSYSNWIDCNEIRRCIPFRRIRIDTCMKIENKKKDIMLLFLFSRNKSIIFLSHSYKEIVSNNSSTPDICSLRKFESGLFHIKSNESDEKK